MIDVDVQWKKDELAGQGSSTSYVIVKWMFMCKCGEISVHRHANVVVAC